MALVVSTLTPAGTGPQKPKITKDDIWAQFRVDIGGKEVQTSETYSHAWVANQFGHVCLGILLGFMLSAILGRGLSLSAEWFNTPASWAFSFPRDNIIGSVLAIVVAAAWEWRAYRKEVRESVGGFPLDRRLLRHNAFTATAYMVLGVAVAFVFRFFTFGPWDRLRGVPVIIWGGLCFLGIVLFGIAIALPWLRQKIVWQKAALPYLFRLADAQPVTPDDKHKLQGLITTSPPPDDPAQQIVIGGPIGSGRTEIGVGLGTEFAFRNAAVRYVSLATLLEFAARSKDLDYFDDMGPTNIDYWGWTRAQVVIIDDIGPVLAGKPQNHFKEFAEILRTQLSKVQAVLQQCHTVWVIGDPRGDGEIATDDELLDRYAVEIGNYCKRLQDPPQRVVVVHLEPRERRNVPRARVRYVTAFG